MLFEIQPETRLVGIARLAAQSEPLRSKQRVEYRDLTTRRYLTRCRSDRVPFDWTINPYRGCEFGCKYCYARYTHEFMELRDPLDFESKIFVKKWNAAAFRGELQRIPETDWIAIGTATDPYQPAERSYRITRHILEVLAGEKRRHVSITTKSNMIARDLDLLRAISKANRLHIGISITTMDAGLARLLEPYAPRPDLRMEAVASLSRAGIQAAVLVCPLLPFINDGEATLDEIARCARKAGAGSFSGGTVFLKRCTHASIFPFLERSFPALAARYRRHFLRQAFLPEPYIRSIELRLDTVRRRNGLERRFPEYQPVEWSPPGQLKLDFGPGPRPAASCSSQSSTCQKYAASL